jgi:hypothetical protein
VTSALSPENGNISILRNVVFCRIHDEGQIPNILQSRVKLNDLSLNFVSLIFSITRTCCSRYQGRGFQTPRCRLRSKLRKPQNFCKVERGFSAFCWVLSAVLSTLSTSFVPCYSDPWMVFSVAFLRTRRTRLLENIPPLPKTTPLTTLILVQHSVVGHN